MELNKIFKDGLWSSEINVRDFVSHNITPYYGDASFLEGPTERTKAVWNRCLEALAEERENNGVRSLDNVTVSTITSHKAGYIDKENELIVGLQTDELLRRAIKPFGGINVVSKACHENGVEVDDRVKDIFTHYRKTHNDGVFDVYTEEIRSFRSLGFLTGLPDNYARGRIIGDYRRMALYGIDRPSDVPSFRTGDKRLGDLGFQQIDYAVQIHLVRDVVVVDHFHLDLGGGVLVDDLPLRNIAQQLDVIRGNAHIIRNLCGVVRDVGQQTRCRIVRQVKAQFLGNAVLEVRAPVVAVRIGGRILDLLLVLHVFRPSGLILDLLDSVGVAVVECVQTAGDIDLHARNKIDELLDRPHHTADDADNVLAELQKQDFDGRNRVLKHVAEEVNKVGDDVVDRQIEHVVDGRTGNGKRSAYHADGADRFVTRPVRVVDVRRDHADENDNAADNQHDRVERHHGIEHLLRGCQRLRSRSTDLCPVCRHRKQRKGCRGRKHQRTNDLDVVRHPVDGFE